MSPLEDRLGHDEFEALEQALKSGKITQAEHDYYLERQLGVRPQDVQETPPGEQTRVWPAVIIATTLLFLLGIGAMFLEGGITGFVVSEVEEHTPLGLTFNKNATYVLDVQNTTTLQLSGAVTNGRATIHARSGNDTWLVVIADTNDLEGLWLDKQSYALNEEISVSVMPDDNYSYWLDANGTKTPVTLPYVTNAPGNYTLEAISNTTKLTASFTVRNDTNAGLDVLATPPTATFTDACDETCVLAPTSNITLIITVSPNATLTIEEMITTIIRENNAPVMVATIPNIIINGTHTLNLSEHFADPDGDELSYEMNNIVGVTEDIDGNTLTLTGDTPGTYEAVIYASDLRAVTQATFTITVPETIDTNQTTNTTTNETTTNQTTNITNQTTNETTQTNNTTTNRTPNANALRCDHPNINLRPPECFGEQFDAAFANIVAPLNDQQQNRVGRFTRLGNLVIRGVVVENVNGTPDNGEFSIGHSVQEQFGQRYVPVAWIDNPSGDLYLRGELHQEVAGLTAPPQDTFIISNNNGIVLGYFDELTGDLYLRGNLVQLGTP